MRADYFPVMNFSFQTACLLFFVTLIHIVVIAAFSPVEEKASQLFSQIDMEAFVDKSLFADRSESSIEPAVEEPKEASLADAPIPGYPGQLMERTRLHAQPVAGPANRLVEEANSLVGLDQNRKLKSEARAALAEKQAYSGRVELPHPEQAATPVVAEAQAEPIVHAMTKRHVAATDAGGREVRQIRPVPRS